jgi:phospholipid/cholesterol/gamma-HCH transport system substrate-binding protein
MENKAHALAAGFFTIFLGIALALIGVWFSKGEIPSRNYVLFTTGSVTGLKTEAPVRYRGVDVGRVSAVKLEPGNTGRVQIEIGVQADTPVTAGTYAQLGFQGVTGIAYVQLNDDGKSQGKLVAEAGKPAQIRMKPSLLDDSESLFTSVSELAEKLGKLIDGDTQEKVRNALAGIEQVTQRAGAVAKKVEPAIDSLPALLAETKGLASDARASIKRVDQVADNADRMIVTANQLALKIDQRIDTLDHVAATARDTGAMVRALNEESVPRANTLIDDISRETRAMNRSVVRVVDSVIEQPQGFVFGPPPLRPGPGESGFNGGK